MSGRITDPLPGIAITPEYWLGICDGCCTVGTFDTKQERDSWEAEHEVSHDRA